MNIYFIDWTSLHFLHYWNS